MFGWNGKSASSTAALVSFVESSSLLRERVGMEVSASQVERAAEALGAEIAADEHNCVEPAGDMAPTMYLGMDGTGVPMRNSEVADGKPVDIAQLRGRQPTAGYAGFWIRVVAYIIDAIILGIVGAVILGVFGVNLSDPNAIQSSRYQGAQGLNFVISLVYFVGLWTALGGTLGQRIFGMRVVDANTGQQIGLGKAVLRFIGLWLSFLVCFVGVIWVAFDARKQGWMDKIAGTFVVR